MVLQPAVVQLGRVFVLVYAARHARAPYVHYTWEQPNHSFVARDGARYVYSEEERRYCPAGPLR